MKRLFTAFGFICSACLTLAACSDGDGPAWADDQSHDSDSAAPETGDSQDSTSARNDSAIDQVDSGDSQSSENQEDSGVNFSPARDRSLKIDKVWGQGLEIEVDDYGWNGDDMCFRLSLIDPETHESAEGIDQHSFSFAENGSPLGSEALYSVEHAKDLRVVLVLDLSQSVREAGALEPLRTAVSALYDSLPRAAHVAIVGFASEHQLLVPFTTDSSKITSAIENLTPPEARAGQFTNLWGAVVEAAKLFDDAEDGARRLIVFTDGRDNVAEKNLTEAAEALIQSRVTPYAIGLGDIDASALRSLTGESRFSETSDPNKLEPLFTDVAARLAEQWTLTYTTPKRQGTHTLDITASRNQEQAGFKVIFTVK